MTFSEQVSKYRRAAKMTQEELAEKIIPILYKKVENLLNDYLDLPQ